MQCIWQKIFPIIMVLLAFSLIEAGLTTDYADARSRGGGRSFSSAPRKAPSQSMQPGVKNQSGSFSRGLMGGLLGGAIGGMLFGSMFGGSGSGMGLLPILLLAGLAYFLYRKMSGASRAGLTPAGWISGGQARKRHRRRISDDAPASPRDRRCRRRGTGRDPQDGQGL